MASNSRFSRSDSSSNTRLNSNKDNPSLSSGDTHLFEKLQRKLDELKSKRMRYEIDLENSKKEIKKYQKEAEDLGIHSLEEMKEYVEKLKKEEDEELEKFKIELEKEESLLNEIEESLKNSEEDE